MELSAVRSEKLGCGFFVSSFCGGWDVLSEEEYRSLSVGKPAEGVLRRLTDRGVVVSDGNASRVREDLRRRLSFLRQPPTLHVVAVTDRCSQSCLYCHAKKSARSMSAETADAVASFILSCPSSFFVVEFQGGESLLNHRTMMKVISEIESGKGDRVVSYRLVSNLSQMTEGRFRELSDLGVGIATSFDGPADLHDKQRDGSYKRVVGWIKYAQKAGCRIEAMPTVTKYSLGRGKEIIDEYVKLRLSSITLRPVSCIGAAKKKWADVGLTAEEYFSFWVEAVDYCMSLWSSGKRIYEGSTVTILEKLFSGGCTNMCARSPCGAGINQLAYDPDGKIFVCDLARAFDEFSVGDVKKTSYAKVVKKTSHLRGLCNLTTLCDACAWSPFCGTCLVSAYSTLGGMVSIKPMDFGCRLNRLQLAHVVELLCGDKKKILLGWLKSARPDALYSPEGFYSSPPKDSMG